MEVPAPITHVSLTKMPRGGVQSGFVPLDWSPELILELDWMRLAELVRAIATQAGCELAGSTILHDGSVVFGMLEQPTTPYPQRALVRVAGWNEWGSTVEGVQRFAREVAGAAGARGIFIAPAGFTPAAVLAALEHRIETVDAQALCAVLKSLPEERSSFLLTIATAGLWSQPTCPVCLGKMERVSSRDLEKRPSVRLISERGLCAEEVCSDMVDIARGADVEFLYPVRARCMRVSGHATGDFSCDGTITIQPGGLLDGRITARSVEVQEGGELRGTFRILDSGVLQPFAEPPDHWDWRCRNLPAKAGCAAVVFEPHGDWPTGVSK